MKNFHGLMPAIDDVIVSMGVENSQDWFCKPLPEGTIREFHRPLVKQPKDPKYSPIMKIKIPVDKSGVPTAEIYNEAKERVSIDSIAKGSSITCIIELSPVWFVNKTFGLTWKLVQAAVTPGPQNFAGYSLLEEEEDW
ncbi:hypothetical protein KSW81_005997 [Nannochloris sp. 'desiccata']|nr:hypothetical protein KSW81_005997 [Chlorella desiccata (nom. nud.)]